MKGNNFFEKLFVMILSCLFLSCAMFSKDNVPYAVSGDFVMEENSEHYNLCGINLNLFNKSEKNIKEFTVVFYLFDSDGEPAEACRNMLSFSIEKNIEAGTSYVCCISLDSYINSIPDEQLMIDYLYISQITFADGSVWNDPYGLLVF